jgi:putative Ca2+/H+ antiporter (TMEM165/GDT1 family)
MKIYLGIFASILLAELGDKTQLATLLFASGPETSRTGVFLAAAAALCLSTLIAVVVGSAAGTWLPRGALRIVGALGFIAIGLWMLLARG